jgi:hypothetical protein
MSFVAALVAAGSPAPSGDQPLPSAASNSGTFLFFFIGGAIVLLGFLMMRAMKKVNSNYADGPDGAYLGDIPEKSSNSSNVGDSNAS